MNTAGLILSHLPLLHAALPSASAQHAVIVSDRESRDVSRSRARHHRLARKGSQRKFGPKLNLIIFFEIFSLHIN